MYRNYDICYQKSTKVGKLVVRRQALRPGAAYIIKVHLLRLHVTRKIIQDVFIYEKMSAAVSKYLQKSGDELRSI